jgi:Rrf2 family transcriptional regulator, iron-sulfur cluster assembly transcription factor
LKRGARCLQACVISRSSEYALRALTFLALGEERDFCLARTLAAELGIPAPFLGKVLQSLVGAGLLESHRGRAGGFRLARPAGGIHVSEVVGVFEKVGGPERCLLGQDVCDDDHACPLHRDWRALRDMFLARLTGTTLADLARFAREAPQSSFPYEHRIASTGARTSFNSE